MKRNSGALQADPDPTDPTGLVRAGGRVMARTVRKPGRKEVPLSEIKNDLSRFLREAETQNRARPGRRPEYSLKRANREDVA